MLAGVGEKDLSASNRGPRRHYCCTTGATRRRHTVGHVELLRKLNVGHGSRLKVLYAEREGGMT